MLLSAQIAIVATRYEPDIHRLRPSPQVTNYTTGTSFDVSPGVDFSYRSFFTFDLPALTNES